MEAKAKNGINNVLSVINHLVIDSMPPISVDFVSVKVTLPVPCVLSL